MTRSEIEKKLIELASTQGGVSVDQVTAVTHFRNDLQFDSLDEMEYAMEVEDEFGVSVPDDAVERLRTVQDVIDLVVKSMETERVA